jgi:hypothetical protein
MKNSAEFRSFASLVDRVISVPKTEILRREAEYKKQSEQNPHKRGPKRKPKPSASPDPNAS